MAPLAAKNIECEFAYFNSPFFDRELQCCYFRNLKINQRGIVITADVD
jgi:hypothetical protein